MPRQAQDPSRNGSGASSRFPRLLVVDPTRTGGKSATGQLKANFLRGWPDEAFLQIFAPRGEEFQVARSLKTASRPELLSADDVHAEVAAYAPDLVYYRPIIDKHRLLHGLLVDLLDQNGTPLVTHLMDDWPARLAVEDPSRAPEIDRELRLILARSTEVLSISAKMSRVYKDRYGVDFQPIANGVDVKRFAAARAAAQPVREGRREIVLRYCGGLAEDMTFHTMADVARAVDELQPELPVRFEVYTMRMYQEAFGQEVSGLRGVKILDGVFGDRFPKLLAEADILVLGYNFDPETERYVGLSIPNKLPEYLASGAAILAVGPLGVNGIEVIHASGLGSCVTERDPEKLSAAIRQLASDTSFRESLAAKGERWVSERLDIDRVAGSFQSILREAAGSAPKQLDTSDDSAPEPKPSEPSEPPLKRSPAMDSDPETPGVDKAGLGPAMSFVGRFGAWTGRKARRYPLLTFLLLATLCGLTAAGFAFADDPLGPVLWALAGVGLGAAALVITAGFLGFLMKEARHDLEMQNIRLRRSMDAATKTLAADQREASRGFETKFEAVETGQRAASERIDAKLKSLEQDHRSELRSTKEHLEARLDGASADLTATKAWLAEEQGALEAKQDAAKAALGVRISALEGELKEAANRLEGKLGALEGEQRAARASLAIDIGGLVSSLGSVKETARADKDSLLAEMRELGEARESIEARIEEVRAEQGAATQEARAQLVLLEAKHLQAMSEATETRTAQQAREFRVMETKIKQLRKRFRVVAEREVSVDIVSALRAIQPVWTGDVESRTPAADGREHGHALLMVLLSEEARSNPSALAGKTLIEIGSTREPDPNQSSTEKLAIYTGLMGMRFVTVDVDPINTARARRVIKHLNPDADAVTQRGEDFLAVQTEPLDFVYLDAFDFEHGQHSDERRKRYRELLDTEIRDEESWRMHQQCAERHREQDEYGRHRGR